MKASKFSEAQIAFVLKQAEGDATIADVRRKAGIGVATFYNWRKKYAGLMPSEMKQLRQLEDENNQLKKIGSHQSNLRRRPMERIRSEHQGYADIHEER